MLLVMLKEKLKGKNIQKLTKDKSNMISILNPKISQGNFLFGDDINKYKNDYDFELSPKDISGYEGYTIYNPETCLFVENGKIASIASYEECIYKGRNLIGMTIVEFMRFTGEKYYGEVDEADFEEDDIPQYIYEFEDIGLQVWEKGKGGKIITIIASK